MYVTFATRSRSTVVDDRRNKVVRVGMTDAEVLFLFPSAEQGRHFGRLLVSRTKLGIRVEVEPASENTPGARMVSKIASSTGRRTGGVAHSWIIASLLSHYPGVAVMDVLRRVIDPARRDYPGGIRSLIAEVPCREISTKEHDSNVSGSGEEPTRDRRPERFADDLTELSAAVSLYNEVAERVSSTGSRHVVVVASPTGKIEVSVTTTTRV